MNYLFAVLILLIWLVMVIELSWSEKSRPVTNIVMGVLVYLIMGMLYLVPFGLIYLT